MLCVKDFLLTSTVICDAYSKPLSAVHHGMCAVHLAVHCVSIPLYHYATDLSLACTHSTGF